MAARGEFAGVYLSMHVDESDDRIALHTGTRVRKDHTSIRGAFRSVGVPLAAVWGKEGLEFLSDSLPPRRKPDGFKPRSKFDGRVSLLKFYPDMPTTLVHALQRESVKAIVIEGTGLGHVNARNVASLREFIEGGGFAFMTSQCTNGRVDMNVYETGRDLLAAGVVPLEDMLPETALTKAMWVLANAESPGEVAGMMTRNLLGEMTTRGFLR
jgi:glutamyl-tRNA(Gln) amidotransferase subunit D